MGLDVVHGAPYITRCNGLPKGPAVSKLCGCDSSSAVMMNCSKVAIVVGLQSTDPACSRPATAIRYVRQAAPVPVVRSTVGAKLRGALGGSPSRAASCPTRAACAVKGKGGRSGCSMHHGTVLDRRRGRRERRYRTDRRSRRSRPDALGPATGPRSRRGRPRGSQPAGRMQVAEPHARQVNAVDARVELPARRGLTWSWNSLHCRYAHVSSTFRLWKTRCVPGAARCRAACLPPCYLSIPHAETRAPRRGGPDHSCSFRIMAICAWAMHPSRLPRFADSFSQQRDIGRQLPPLASPHTREGIGLAMQSTDR